MPFVPKDAKEPSAGVRDSGVLETAPGAGPSDGHAGHEAEPRDREPQERGVGHISGVMPREAAWGPGDGDDVRGWRAIVSAESWRDRLDLLVACAVIGWADLAWADVVDADDETVRSRIARRPVVAEASPSEVVVGAELDAAHGAGARLASVLANTPEARRWEGWERPCASTELLRRRAARAFGWPDLAGEPDGQSPSDVVESSVVESSVVESSVVESVTPPGWPSGTEGEWISLPLLGRDRSLGCLTFWSAEGSRSDHDLGRACRLAHFGALSLDEALRRGLSERASGNAELAAAVFDERLRELAHELRTPLSSALLWLTVYRSGSASTTPPLDALEQCIRQQQKIIDEAVDPPTAARVGRSRRGST